MDAVEILFALENEFDITIPDDEVRSVRNVRQMCEGVEKLVAAKVGGREGRPVADAARRHHRHGRDLRLGRNCRGVRASPCRQGRSGIGPIESTDMSQIALSERRRGAAATATSLTSKTAAPTSSTASRSSR